MGRIDPFQIQLTLHIEFDASEDVRWFLAKRDDHNTARADRHGTTEVVKVCLMSSISGLGSLLSMASEKGRIR